MDSHDLIRCAERVTSLLDVSFSAIYISNGPNGSGNFGFKFALDREVESLDKTVFEEYVKRRVQLAEEQKASTSVRQIHLNGESTPWNRLGSQALDECRYLSFAGVEKRGWVAIGSQKALSFRQESLLLSAADYLTQILTTDLLEETIRLRNQFLSVASHELKTPLTSIYGVLQLQERMLRLKKDESPQTQIERQHHFLKMVIRQVERLNELIDGLLDISRIQSGRFVVEPTDTDAALILQEAISARLTIIAEEANVQLHVDSPATLSAWVDPVRMEEVITNLVMNAIRFSPEGGIVWIKLRGNDDSFRFTVRDQGPSVPVEDRERIFQPFERAQRTSRLGGLGLGLFISRQIAQLHGGNVSLVESVPGKGNVFEAYFPTRNINLVSASA